MYCRADVHFIVFYLEALRDAFSKVKDVELKLKCHTQKFNIS